MNRKNFAQDLVILTADKNTQFALEGLLTRPKDLGIRPITKTIFVHDHRDSGVLRESHEFLRPYLKTTQYALVILDREGCGKEEFSREEIETEIEHNMAKNGWRDRCAAIAIDPELEIWVWTRAEYVAQAFGWKGNYASLHTWLVEKGFLESNSVKPSRPKEAMEAALSQTKIPRSSSLFKELAKAVPFKGCTDPAFQKLKNTLQSWFPR
jgi:hypothetical protein